MAQAAPFALVGLSALGTMNSISTAQKQHALAKSKARLDLARSRNQEQQNLGRNLARQNVVGAARGVSRSSGSLMNQAVLASRNARHGIGLAAARSSGNIAGSRISTGSRINGALLSFGTTLARQGPRIQDVFEGRAPRSE